MAIINMVVHATDVSPFDGAHLSCDCQFGTRFSMSKTENGADDTQVLPEAG